MGVYDDLGVATIINANGEVTRLGGTLMLPEVRRAMDEAAQAFVFMPELQEAAGRTIAAIIGSESGYVTSGAAAALTLAAAACIAGTDPTLINRLPDTNGIANEVVIPTTHRNSYDRCFRIAGARIVTAGRPDGCSREELAVAFGPRTVAAGWFADRADAGPTLTEVVEVAHRAGVPVIVDAALALPPAENLTRFIREGADLVAFSGGKTLRGPQASGILAGRATFIRSVAMQHQNMGANAAFWRPISADPDNLDLGSPGHGIGRPMKVGKEELVGALTALRCYAARDHAAEAAEVRARLHTIAGHLQGIDGAVVRIKENPPMPRVLVTIDPTRFGCEAEALYDRLCDGRPRIFLSPGLLAEQTLGINPVYLHPDEVELVARRVRAVLEHAGQ